jgi:hypothetical protein
MLGSAVTFSKMTLNIRTLIRMTHSIQTFTIISLIMMGFSIMKFNKTFSITTLGTMTSSLLRQP